MGGLAIEERQEPVEWPADMLLSTMHSATARAKAALRCAAKTVALGLLLVPCVFAFPRVFAASQDAVLELLERDDLIAAVAKNDGERVAALLAAGANVNEARYEGVAALHLAAVGGDAAIVAQLLKAGANVHAAAEGTAATPLHMAAANRDSAVAKALLNAGASVAAVTTEGATPLDLAVRLGNVAMARALIDAGAAVNVQPTAQAVTFLHVAASQGARELAAVLIEAGARLEATDAAGHTPLHHAAERAEEGGEEGVAQLLIDAGANVNAQDARGLTALHMAVGSNRHVLAESLLDAGANIDARASDSADGVTALHIAAAGGWLDCVGLLLRRGAAVDPLAAAGVGTPLLAAVEKGREHAAAALIEYGADASVKNEQGETAAAIAERKGMTEVLARLGEADETSGPAGDIDAEVFERQLTRAIERDAPDTVLRLLDGVDAAQFGFSPLHEAARHGSLRVAEALLDAGLDVNAGVTKPLHVAARNESPEVAALLIERGAEVNAKDAIGWTPLHYALLRNIRRPGLRAANVLLEHGADVNAATAAVGWTPLHLAAHLGGAHVWSDSDEPSGWSVAEYGHGPDVLGIVQTLIERGADVGARTRVGGWSPARVAKASDGRRRYGLDDDGALSRAVRAAIQAAGGKDEGCDDAPMLPTYGGGRAWHEPRQRDVAVAAGCEFNLSFSVPGAIDAGGRTVAGSFTAPGADEALQFAGIGILDGNRWFDVASLQDRHGTIRPFMAFDRFTDYQGLCLDQETNTHVAVFERSYDGNCCEWVDTAYYRYGEDAGSLVELPFDDVGRQRTGEDATCRWHDVRPDLEAYEDALSKLRVGDSPTWPQSWDADYEPFNQFSDPRWEGLLPTRVVSSEVVEAQLERLRALPYVAHVRSVDLGSPGWKLAVVTGGDPRSKSVVCGGVLLAWNEARQEWRSIYDCLDTFHDIELHGDTLSAALWGGTVNCGIGWRSRSCYLEVDLKTWQAELWEEPHGEHWSNRRERPSR